VCGICGVAFRHAEHGGGSTSARDGRRDGASRARTKTAFLVNDARAPGLALGMRRLSIIDLAGGQQPIWNETHDVAVVMNGELYNYREVRERLTRLGHKFKTQSDTEILVHAWEEWSEEFLAKFAGCLRWRLRISESTTHRDRYFSWHAIAGGSRPLYYTQGPEGFAFASEVRALSVQTQRRAEFFRKTR